MIEKTVRLYSDIYNKLVDDAMEKTLKPAALARMIIIQRLENGNWQELAEICDKLPVISNTEPRFCIRIPDRFSSLIEDATGTISKSQFGPMAQSVLVEHYSTPRGKTVRKVGKA